MTKMVIYSRHKSEQCFRESMSRSDSGFCGWARLEQEVLFTGEVSILPRIGEKIQIEGHAERRAISAYVEDVVHLPEQNKVHVTLGWHDEDKLKTLMEKVRSR